jgi:uncharacterized membrane protein YqaE (UPF0057 family)
MLRSVLKFRTRHQPYMVRASYRAEMRSALTYPLAAALAEGSFTGVVATKFFQASPVLLAVITAAPMFGNVMALVWAELARTRPKVRFVNWLQFGVITAIAAVALTRPLPREIGGWAFAALIIAARVLASGIITIRSSIWRFNYPRQTRGQIIGRISVVATTVLALTTLLGALWLDRDPGAFVYLYPMAALLGGIGIWQFSQIRVRGEGQRLRQEQARERQPVYTARPEEMAQTDETNVMNYEPGADEPSGARKQLRRFFAESAQILREDRQFRLYQWWQFFNGASFLLMAAPLMFMVSREMTNVATQYALATVVLQLIPMITSIVSTQFWAPLFDRVHISTFRVAQGLVSISAHALLLTGALTNQLWLVAVAQFVVGISNAAGNLAWNLGQYDFAPPEKTAAYMGVHVMLTGLRGSFAPFLGVWLYSNVGMGRWVFAISIVLCVISTMGFISMARKAPRKMSPERVKRMTQATGREQIRA